MGSWKPPLRVCRAGRAVVAWLLKSWRTLRRCQGKWVRSNERGRLPHRSLYWLRSPPSIGSHPRRPLSRRFVLHHHQWLRFPQVLVILVAFRRQPWGRCTDGTRGRVQRCTTWCRIQKRQDESRSARS